MRFEDFTDGGKNSIKQANKYPILRNYYDPMTGCFLFSEKKYDENEDLRKEVILYLKNAVVYIKNGETDSEKTWILELIQGYDDEQDELGNDAWLYSIREVEVWN